MASGNPLGLSISCSCIGSVLLSMPTSPLNFTQSQISACNLSHQWYNVAVSQTALKHPACSQEGRKMQTKWPVALHPLAQRIVSLKHTRFFHSAAHNGRLNSGTTKQTIMTITKEGDELRIGCDFVAAVTGPYKSHGMLEIHGLKPMRFLSTFGCSESSDALIRAAREEGKRIANIMTQSL